MYSLKEQLIAKDQIEAEVTEESSTFIVNEGYIEFNGTDNRIILKE
ncbi:MAG: hypothetical protein GX660_14050 [Clostridiaceae bacterium]|nr:hypothetical protein [Clostridiaceae bacterium]